MTDTSIAVKEKGGELSAAESIAAEVAAAQQQEYGPEDLLQTPILKVGQALTKEVQDGDAESGEFINTLTNEGLGDVVEFINCYYNKGRFASDKKTDRAFVAFSSEIPASWEPLVGPDFIGTPFAEYPEAEEAYRAAVNAKEREWEKGPLVSTTHNFTGLVLVEADEGVEYQPVRLSLKRTDVPAARKINTIQRAVLRNRPAWDAVLRLSTIKKTFGKNSAFVINPSDLKKVRDTTAEEKELAAEVAMAVLQGRINTVGDIEDRPVEPSSGGGLEVG